MCCFSIANVNFLKQKLECFFKWLFIEPSCLNSLLVVSSTAVHSSNDFLQVVVVVSFQFNKENASINQRACLVYVLSTFVVCIMPRLVHLDTCRITP